MFTVKGQVFGLPSAVSDDASQYQNSSANVHTFRAHFSMRYHKFRAGHFPNMATNGQKPQRTASIRL
jgi:hypothetical protein